MSDEVREGMVATRAYAERVVADATGGIDVAAEVARIDRELARIAVACPQYYTLYDAVEGKWYVPDTAGPVVFDKGIVSRGGTIAAIGDGSALKFDVYEDGEFVREASVAEEFASLRSDLERGTALKGGRGITVADGEVSLGYDVVRDVANYLDDKLVTSRAVYEALAAARYSLPAATATALGGVKVGTGLSVTSDGTLSADPASGFVSSVSLAGDAEVVPDGGRLDLPAATAYAYGVVKAGSGISVEGGVISSEGEANLVDDVVGPDGGSLVSGKVATVPKATAYAYGAVKVGRGLSVEDGVISSEGEANLVEDVVGPDGRTVVTGKVAALPVADGSSYGLVKAGFGLVASSGTLSVDGGAVATAERVDDVAAAVEAMSGMSDALVDADPSDDGTVALSSHRVTFIRVPAASGSLKLVLPAPAAAGFARDLCAVLAFPDEWSGGSFTVSSVTAADGADLTMLGVGGAPDFSGASAGGRIALYFTEYMANAFMVSAKALVPFMFQEAT